MENIKLSENNIFLLINDTIINKNINLLNQILIKQNKFIQNITFEQISKLIYNAISSKDVAIINVILELFLKSEVYIMTYQKYILIYNIIMSNDNYVLNKFLEKFNKHNIDFSDSQIFRLIHFSITTKNIEILDKMLEKFYSVEIIFSANNIYLLIYDAIISNNINILNKILKLFYSKKIIYSNNDKYSLNLYGIHTRNFEIMSKILITFEITITVDILFQLIKAYKIIINKNKETLLKLFTFNEIFNKIKDKNIITKDFYHKLCEVILSSGSFIFDKINRNINSKSILYIITYFQPIFDIEKKYNQLIQKEFGILSFDILSYIGSFESDR
jgi:hypothetical protein